jgi:outer membrane protein assembly factor BamD
MWRNPALDPTYGETALATYRELLSRYPGTPAAQRANLRVQQLNERLADKDYRNGVFYLRLRAYDSAIIYFKDVVATYPQSSYAALSVVRLVEIYRRLGYDDERNTMCVYLHQYYPDTPGAAGTG